MAKKTGGYVTVFGRTGGGLWVSGQISPKAAKLFQAKKREIVALYREVNGAAPTQVSKANVIEYLLLGPEKTRAIFEELKG